MKNWLLVLFITLTLGSNIYFHYQVRGLYAWIGDAHQKINNLEKAPQQKSCSPYPECETWPEINDKDYPPAPQKTSNQKFSDNYLSCRNLGKNCDLVEGKERKRLIGGYKMSVQGSLGFLKDHCLTLHKLNDNSRDCYWRNQ